MTAGAGAQQDRGRRGYPPAEDNGERDVNIHPGANEACSKRVDDDCDQRIDETDADCWD